MTREELQNVIDNQDLDIDKKITEILNQVNSEKEIAVKTAVNEQKLNTEKVEQQLSESKAALTKLKKDNGDNEELQKTIDDLTVAQEQLQAKYDSLKIDSAVKLALTETGARNVNIAALALDKDLIKLDKDGELVGLKEQIEKLKSSEDTSFLFEAEPTTVNEEPEEPKRQPYEPVKGAKPETKSQGAELGDRILKERQRRENLLKNNNGGND